MTYLSINHDYGSSPISRYLSDFGRSCDDFSRMFSVFDTLYQSTRFEMNETKEGYALTMPLPGFKKTDVKVELDSESHLSVRAQKGDSRVERTVVLGSDIDTDSLTAKLEDGMLTLTVKKLPRAQPRQITIL